MADMLLMHTATFVTSPPANMLKRRPRSWNVGAPGGCPTNSLLAVAMYSPQSHHEAVGSAVII